MIIATVPAWAPAEPAAAASLTPLQAAVFGVMADGRLRTVLEIQAALMAAGHKYYPLATVAARLRELRSPGCGGHQVVRERIYRRGTLWGHRLIVNTAWLRSGGTGGHHGEEA